MTTTKRKKIGPLPGLPQPAERAPAAEQPRPRARLYVVFYFVDKTGNSGFSNVILSDIFALRTENDILMAMLAIKNTRPDDPDFYQDLCITNWLTLEG